MNEQAYSEFAPRTDEERRLAAVAVADHREAAQTQANAHALTPFEGVLIEHAYARGRRAVIDAIEAAIGPAARTADAPAVIAAAKRVDVVQALPRGSEYSSSFNRVDHQVVDALVLSTFRHLERFGDEIGENTR